MVTNIYQRALLTWKQHG